MTKIQEFPPQFQENLFKAKLAQKIGEVAADIGAVEPNGTNAKSKYSYISADQLKAILRNALKKHKLQIIKEVVSYEEREGKTVSQWNGQEQVKYFVRSIVHMNFEIIDCETGYSITKAFTGADQDYGGKSFQQAVTACSKYFHFNLFNVSTEKDIDGDSETVESIPTKAVKPTPQKQTTKKAITTQVTKPTPINSQQLLIIEGSVKSMDSTDVLLGFYNSLSENLKEAEEVKTIFTSKKNELKNAAKPQAQ